MARSHGIRAHGRGDAVKVNDNLPPVSPSETWLRKKRLRAALSRSPRAQDLLAPKVSVTGGTLAQLLALPVKP